jgi:hypothetical protein
LDKNPKNLAREEITDISIFFQARNAIGNEGFVPENYISYIDDQTSYTPTAETDYSAYGTTTEMGSGTAQASGAPQASCGTDRTSYCSQQSGFSDSAEQVPQSPPDSAMQTEAVSSYSSTDYEVQNTMGPQDLSLEGMA